MKIAEAIARKQKQRQAAEAAAEFLIYTEVYKKAKAAGNEIAAEAAIEAKQKINIGRKELEARKARAEAVAAAAAADADKLPAMLAEAKIAAAEYLYKIEIASRAKSEAKKAFFAAEAGSEAEAAAAANLYESIYNKILASYYNTMYFNIAAAVEAIAKQK